MENLNNQKHYILNIDGREINTIEIINAILENLGVTGKEAFHIGNVLKYVIRYKHKNDHEDLNKALVYLEYVLGIKSRIELKKGFKMEIKDLLLKNAELEIQLDSKINEVHNLKVDLEKKEKVIEELEEHIKHLNNVIVQKDNKIYELERNKPEKVSTKQLVEELKTREGVTTCVLDPGEVRTETFEGPAIIFNVID